MAQVRQDEHVFEGACRLRTLLCGLYLTKYCGLEGVFVKKSSPLMVNEYFYLFERRMR